VNAVMAAPSRIFPRHPALAASEVSARARHEFVAACRVNARSAKNRHNWHSAWPTITPMRPSGARTAALENLQAIGAGRQLHGSQGNSYT